MSLGKSAFGSLLAAAIVLAPATWAQVAPDTRSDVVQPGCYRLTLGPWSRPPRFGPDQPTAVVRLDTIARTPGLPGDLVAERVEPAEFAPPGDWRLRWKHLAYWRRDGADSVTIVTWSIGTAAEVFYGHRARGALRGVLRMTTDGLRIDPLTRQIQWDVWPWATASAVKVACP